MLKTPKGIAVVALLIAPAFASACSHDASQIGLSAPGEKRAPRGGEWLGPVVTPGYENRNGCQLGTHGVPFPNGNGFRCVPDGW
jgi:hypothetical protein